MEEPTIQDKIEKGELFKNIDVTEFKILKGPCPIKPTKSLTEAEIQEFLTPKKE